MNRPNTKGLLGKRLSVPVTPAVFGPFIPGTFICSHNYSIMYQKSNVRDGNKRKSRALGGEKSLTGAWTGAGAGVEKTKKPHPGPLTGAGREIELWAGQFRGPASFGAPKAL